MIFPEILEILVCKSPYLKKKVHICFIDPLLLLFSRLVVSNSLWFHGLQHARLLSFTISWSLLKFISIELVMLSNHLILCHTFLLLPSVFLCIRVNSNELCLCIRCPKNWSFSFSICLSNESSGFISFRINRFDLLASPTNQPTKENTLYLASLKQSLYFFFFPFSVIFTHSYCNQLGHSSYSNYFVQMMPKGQLLNCLTPQS